MLDPKGLVTRADLNSLSVSIHEVIVPGLRRILPGIIIPSEVTVVDGGAVGRVRITRETRDDGRVRVVGVGAVEVRTDLVKAPLLLPALLGHEFGHYHEATIRMKQHISVGSHEAFELWSEYFAQRVATAAFSDRMFAMDKSNATLAYWSVHVRAEIDAGVTWYDIEEGARVRERLADPGISDLPKLFRAFPDWRSRRQRERVQRFEAWCAEMARRAALVGAAGDDDEEE